MRYIQFFAKDVYEKKDRTDKNVGLSDWSAILLLLTTAPALDWFYWTMHSLLRRACNLVTQSDAFRCQIPYTPLAPLTIMD